MEIEITEQEENYLIEILTSQKAALAARIDGEERIYLPEQASSDSTYYVEKTDSLIRTEKGYRLKTEHRPEKVDIIT